MGRIYFHLSVSLLVLYLSLLVECRPRSPGSSAAGLGLPRTAVNIKFSGGAASTGSNSPLKDQPWMGQDLLPVIHVKKVFDAFRGKKLHDGQVKETVSGIGQGFSLYQQAIVLPLIMLSSAPQVAPISEQIFETMSTVSKTILDAILKLLKEVGLQYKKASKKLVKLQSMFFVFLDNTSKAASEYSAMIKKQIMEELEFFRDELAYQFMAFSSKMTAFMTAFVANSRNIITSTYSSLCTAVSKSKNGLITCAEEITSTISSAVVVAANELKLISDLTASIVAQGATTTCNLISTAVCDFALEVLHVWEAGSSFVTYAAGATWEQTVTGTIATLKFMKTVAEFIADSLALGAETTYRSILAVPKSIWKGVCWFKNKVPVWLDKFVDKMPFLAKDDNEVVLTPASQSIIYLASTVAALHPSFKAPAKVPSNSVSQAVSTAIENVKSRYFPPRGLFLAGSLARGVHLSTSLVYTFQPSLGLGALVNTGAIVANEQWIACIVAGWFASPKIWKFFGAKAPEVSPKNGDETWKGGWFK